MTTRMKTPKKKAQQFMLVILGVLVSVLLPAACGPSVEDLAAVEYAPLRGGEWPVSTPEEQGLDPMLVADLYFNAAELPTVYSMLVFKNGHLIAEDYFNGGSSEQNVNVHSVTKSITSALVGITLDEGCLTNLDQRMMGFFPELADRISDPRKNQITIRQMLQMRAGCPGEESGPELFELLATGFRPSNLVDVPLVREPGSDFDYSNLTAHLLGLVAARACGTDLKSCAQKHLIRPLEVVPGFWQTDWEGNYLGYSDIHLSACDLAKFGLMYLNDGKVEGKQIVPADWTHESRRVFSENAWKIGVGRDWDDNGYGYQWWPVRAGDYRYSLAWGHGGQQIALIDDLDIVIVVTVDPLHLQWGDEPRRLEKGNLNLVADFIASIPR